MLRFAILVVFPGVALALGWWAYAAQQERAKQEHVYMLVQDSTSRLRQGLGLMMVDSEAHRKLETNFGALQSNVEKLQSLDPAFNPALVSAADSYLTDVQVLLQKQLATHISRDAVRADMKELSAHLKGASERSANWIPHAIVLKERLERHFFDYRLASGALENSLRTLNATRATLEPLVAPELVIEEESLTGAHKQLLELLAQFTLQVEKARRLPQPGQRGRVSVRARPARRVTT